MFDVQDAFLFMLILMRVVGLFMLVPMFSHSSLPVMVRVGFASAFGIIALPLVEFSVPFPDTLLELVLFMAKECAVGLTMGFAVRMLFFVLDFASYVLTVEIGLMPSPEFDPSNAGAFNPLGSIVYFLGLMLLLSGSEYDIFRAFLMSYEVAPIDFMAVNENAAEFIIKSTMGIFRIGILMSAPVIAVNFLVNLVFAVMGKVVPKLNVFILSFAAKILCGTTILVFSVGLIVYYILGYIDETPEMMMRFIIFRPIL